MFDIIRLDNLGYNTALTVAQARVDSGCHTIKTQEAILRKLASLFVRCTALATIAVVNDGQNGVVYFMVWMVHAFLLR
jgi:hypothetical protein